MFCSQCFCVFQDSVVIWYAILDFELFLYQSFYLLSNKRVVLQCFHLIEMPIKLSSSIMLFYKRVPYLLNSMIYQLHDYTPTHKSRVPVTERLNTTVPRIGFFFYSFLIIMLLLHLS